MGASCGVEGANCSACGLEAAHTLPCPSEIVQNGRAPDHPVDRRLALPVRAARVHYSESTDVGNHEGGEYVDRELEKWLASVIGHRCREAKWARAEYDKLQWFQSTEHSSAATTPASPSQPKAAKMANLRDGTGPRELPLRDLPVGCNMSDARHFAGKFLPRQEPWMQDEEEKPFGWHTDHPPEEEVDAAQVAALAVEAAKEVTPRHQADPDASPLSSSPASVGSSAAKDRAKPKRDDGRLGPAVSTTEAAPAARAPAAAAKSAENKRPARPRKESSETSDSGARYNRGDRLHASRPRLSQMRSVQDIFSK
eukprot:TRINITY_DN56894_c0_g1_i1.p1 TRINITY_DN56894_c0_g1~~TRINITY_DN56894_c0_g1_i1.p1  ORF type:complete len:336 (-),score=67.96 TRINITY_DN56894_c0_g1_i1:92-1024(-)